MRIVWTALLLTTLPLAGCIGTPPTDPLAPSTLMAPLPRLALGETLVEGTAALVWSGTLRGTGAGCPADCASATFRLELPEGYWQARPGALEVSVSAPLENDDVTFTVEVRDASGRVVAHGAPPDYFPVLEQVFGPIPIKGHIVHVPSAAPGDYTVVVHATRGEGEFLATMQVEHPVTHEGPARDLLPDLVTLTPTNLRVESPAHNPVEPVAQRAIGVRGCGTDEATEAGARRCLRFGNTVANVGEGAFEARLPSERANAALAGLPARFVQRIFDSAGGHRDADVGPAEFHLSHGHFHYSGLASFTLHAYDPDTGTRGEQVAQGRKVGFCLADIGAVDATLPGTVPRTYDGSGCFVPDQGGSYWMGMGVAWYDLYWWQLADQYVEITGIQDGVYELVSVTNSEGTLIEADLTNNEASLVFRLRGDAVEVLFARGGA